MPNHCENDLQIYADEPEEVKKVVEFLKGDRHGEETAIDFNKIFPYPAQYSEMDDAANRFEMEFKTIDPNDQQALNTLRAKYGVSQGRSFPKDGYNSGGYEWCNENWGTKWNAYKVTTEIDEYLATYHFQTAWSPATKIVGKIAEMFPNVQITHEYYERGMEYCGSARYEGGEMKDHAESKYFGIRGG